MTKSVMALGLLGAVASACGGSTGALDEGSSDGDGSTDSSDGSTDGGSTDGGSTDGGSTDGGMSGTPGGGVQISPAPVIDGGGSNAAPLAPGCGPDTAEECIPEGGGCSSPAFQNIEVKDSGAVCFFGPEAEVPSATVEYITEVNAGTEYVHLRVIFDPNFVDTVYGECSPDTGWPAKRGHTFKDLTGSDHVELLLSNCDSELSMHMKVDFISEGGDSACGYDSLGVTGGDGSLTVGNAEDVLAVATSMDRNMNGCGYCETVDSPCPSSEDYDPSETAPEWDFRMVYELWIDAKAFGDAGFCTADIEYVHASPAKGSTDTIEVEPDDCGGGGGNCPPNYELFLTSEGEFLCGGPPEDGKCATGYTLDLTSEGELCIPE